jgi:hypothetical protein
VAFREVRVHEVREVLRHWLGDEIRLRPIAERAGVDRKTARRYIEAAVEWGLVRECGEGQLTDELIGAVIAAVRPERSQGHWQAWQALLAVEDEIRGWIEAELQLTNIHGTLTRRGVVVPYRTLHRFAAERCGFGRRQAKVRVADGEPGVAETGCADLVWGGAEGASQRRGVSGVYHGGPGDHDRVHRRQGDQHDRDEQQDVVEPVDPRICQSGGAGRALSGELGVGCEHGDDPGYGDGAAGHGQYEAARSAGSDPDTE